MSLSTLGPCAGARLSAGARRAACLTIAWGAALSPVAWAGTTAVLSFDPPTIAKGGSSKLLVSFANDAASAVTVSAGSPLTLPAGLRLTGEVGSTCTGLALSTSGQNLRMDGSGTIPAATGGDDTQLGRCEISAGVQSDTLNTYAVPLAAQFFSTSDGANPPGTASAPTLTVTELQPVTIELRSTRGSNTARWPQPVVNSLGSPHASDFAPSQRTRYRFVLRNPNAVALTGVNLAWPALPEPSLAVIPNSLLPESLVTDTSAGLSTGVDAACGGGMVLNGAGLPVLSGATIPANGSCEASFLVRYDAGFGAASDGFNFTYSLGQGLLGSAQGVSNAAMSSVQQRQHSHYTGSELTPASGYTGDAFTLLLKLVNAGSTTPMDTSSGPTGAVVPGLVWKIGEGVEPELAKFPPAGFVPAAGCPALRATDWDSTARTLTVQGRLPSTNCLYRLPFRSVYAGPDDVKDIAITPLAPHRFTTAGGGLASTGPMNMTTMDPRFHAVNGVSTADAVTIDARLLNSEGAVTNNIPRGGLAMLELTLNAPQGVSDFNLRGTGQLRNASTAFSYLPAPISSCGGTIVAPVGGASFRLTGANIAAGGTCTVRLMVASRDWGVNFAVRAGDAYGIVAGNRVFSPGYSWDPIHFSGEYFAVSHQFSPAVVGRNAPQTVYTWSLKKPAGRPPVEALTADVNLALVSGLDLGLKAFEVVSDTCKATINGVAPGASPADYPLALPAGGVSVVQIRNASTPDAEAQGAGPYDNSTGLDAAAFAESTCEIKVRLRPDEAILAALLPSQLPASHQVMGLPKFLSTNNGGLGQNGFIAPGNASYTLVAGPFDPVTLGMSFTPNQLGAGEVSRMRISLDNSLGTTVDLTGAALLDDYVLYAGGGLINSNTPDAKVVTLSGPACEGTPVAVPGGTSVALAQGSIPSGSVCAIEVNVLATSPKGATNTVPAAAFTSEQGISAKNAPAASIVLNASLGVVSAFVPAEFNYDPINVVNNRSTLTLSLLNSFGETATLLQPYTHSLPENLRLDGPVSITGAGCGSLTASGTPGGTGFVLGGEVPAASTCAVSAPVVLADAPAIQEPAVALSYTDTVAEGGLQVRIGGAGGNETQNLAAAEATLQVFAAARVTISKRVSGEIAGAPEAGLYGVNLTCAKSGSIPLRVSEAAPAVQEIVAGDDCTVSEDSNKPAAKAGYHWERESITPAADFVTMAGGAHAVTIDNPLALNALVSISTALNATTASLSPADLGGTAPDLMLLCTPAATGAAPAWQAPEAAQCQLSTTGGEAPADHALGAVAYGGSGVHAQTGAFVAPASGINDLAAVVTLTRTPVTGVPQAIPALHPAMLLVLSGGLGWLAGRARRRERATST